MIAQGGFSYSLAEIDNDGRHADGDFESGDLVLAFRAGLYLATAEPRKSQIRAAVDLIFAEADQDKQTPRAFLA